MKKTLVGWVIGDEKLPTCIGTIIGHYKHPYQPTRCFFVAQFGSLEIKMVCLDLFVESRHVPCGESNGAVALR